MVDNSNFTRTDRDLLIRVDTKVDAMAQQIKDLSDGTSMRLLKLETKHETDLAKVNARLDAQDVYHAKINLEYYNGLAKWVETFKANIGLIYGLVVLFNGLITALILWAIQTIFKVKL